MTPAPKRRWFQWSLRTLFIASAVVAALLWLGGLDWLAVLAMWAQGTKC